MAFIRSLLSHGRYLVLTAVIIGLAVWVLFLDSHSVADRVQWHQEHAELQAENERLQTAIDTLNARLKRPLSDELVEQIAREEYGMQREGETVYPVAASPE